MPPSKKKKPKQSNHVVSVCSAMHVLWSRSTSGKEAAPMCKSLCVCMSFILQSSLFVIVVQKKRQREYWLCLRAGNRNSSSSVTCFTGTHGGGTPGNPHKTQSSCHVNKCAIETVSRWHAPARPLPVWFFSDCFSFWQTLGCFLAPLHSYVAPIPAKQEDNFSQSFLDMPIILRLCLCVWGNIPVPGSLVSSWARSQGLTFSCAPPAPLSESSAPGLSSSFPSLSGVLVYSAAQGPCDKKNNETMRHLTISIQNFTVCEKLCGYWPCKTWQYDVLCLNS